MNGRFIQTYGTHIIVGVSVGGQDVLCVKQKPSSTISPAELRGYLEDLGDCLFSDGASPSLPERKTKDGKRKVYMFFKSLYILNLVCFYFSNITLNVFFQVPEVFSRMLQPHTLQFTNITETSSKDVSWNVLFN